MAEVQGPSVLLEGPTGVGKTHSISTLCEAGLDVFVIITEPTGLDSLLNVWEAKNLPLDKLHYMQIMPARTGFGGILEIAKKVSVLDFGSLAGLKPASNRGDAQFLKLLGALSNFVCDRTGEEFGDVQKFGPDRALVIDSLSGINSMALDIVVGDKVSLHQGEWGIAMGLIEKLLLNLCSGMMCTFVMMAHIGKVPNEVTGGTTISVDTLGNKLAPKLPKYFSEVVMAWKESGKFYWSTSTNGADLKNRSLPLGEKLDPSFKPVIEAYTKRLAFTKSDNLKTGT